MSRRRTGALAAAVLAGIFGVDAVPTTTPAGVISDTFTVSDGTGTAGADLNGSLTEAGGATWIAHSSIDFNADGTIQRTGSVGNNVAVVPVTPTSSVLTISAKFWPKDSADNSINFTGVGFTANTNLGPFWGADGAEVWMHIRENGNYQLLARDANIQIATGTAPNFVADGFNTVQLTLSLDSATPNNNKVSAWINGTQIANNVPFTAAWGFNPDPITGAGFFMNANQSIVDEVSISGVAVPEPAAGLVFLGAGSIGLLAARRRRG